MYTQHSTIAFATLRTHVDSNNVSLANSYVPKGAVGDERNIRGRTHRNTTTTYDSTKYKHANKCAFALFHFMGRRCGAESLGKGLDPTSYETELDTNVIIGKNRFRCSTRVDVENMDTNTTEMILYAQNTYVLQRLLFRTTS